MTTVGERDRLIRVVRPTVAQNEVGQDVETGAAFLVEEAFAKVRFGLAQEKREAAQKGGLQTATFEVLPTTALLAATLTDKIDFDGPNLWDIAEVAPLDRQTLRFTATRNK